MFNLKEYREPIHCLADVLPWAAMVVPGVVLNKDGSFQQTLQFRGADLESSTEEELVSIAARLNHILKQFRGGWAFFIEAMRYPSQAYPVSTFPDKASAWLDEERQEFFAEADKHYESGYFFTLVYMPPEERAIKAQAKLIEHSAETGAVDYNRHLAYFCSQASQVASGMEGILPYLHPLTAEETLTYLHHTVSTKRHKVTMPEIPMYLDTLLPDMPLKGGMEPMLGEDYLKTITITSFPTRSVPGILNALNNLPIEYRWVTRYIALDKQEAIKHISAYRRKWFAKRKGITTMIRELITHTESIATDGDAVQKSQDANAALEEVSADSVGYGYFTATVTVWDKDYTKANEKAKAVENIINSLGFVAHNEKVQAVQAWLGTIPGQCVANVRKPLLSTLNVAHLIPLSAVWAGEEMNAHLKAPPLLQAVTSGNTPFRLVTHVGDVGHTMVIGPTGAGKSVLLSLLALQFSRYENSEVYIFDKGKSARVATLACGGEYYDLGNDQEHCAFQPLANIADEAEQAWAMEWAIQLLVQEGVAITPEIKKEVWDSLKSLATAPERQRTLHGLSRIIQSNTLRQALQPYTMEGPYGNILDANQDSLRQGRWHCFEMETLMNRAGIIAPVLTYLFHQLEKRFTGNPTMLILDEAWLFLDNPMFASKIREWLKVLRKANVSVVFATQSIADAINSTIAPALIESCPTRIFLPNTMAMEEDCRELYKRFGLNKRQIQILATATPKRHYYYQSPLGNRLIELGLREVGLALCGSSSKEQQKLVDAVLSRYGKENFLEAFLSVKGISNPARLKEAA